MDSAWENLFSVYFCVIIYQIKELEILFFPRHHILMSENVLN